MSSITVSSTGYTVMGLTVEEALGEFDKFKCVLPNPSSTQRSALGVGGHIYPDHHVSIPDKYGTVFEGFLENVQDDESTTHVVLEGRDYRCLLVDERTGLQDEWINQTGNTIINALLAYSTKVVAGTIDFPETVDGTAHFNHESLLNAIASVCNNAGKDFWITRSGSTFSLNVGARGSGSSGTPAHTWTTGEELVSANEQKLARDIINRQRVFGAGDGINRLAVCVPYIDIDVADDARHAGFGGVAGSCVHADATTNQASVGVMEGEPYVDNSIIDTEVAIATAKAILDASVGDGAKKLGAIPKGYLENVALGDWTRIIDPYKDIDRTARIKKITRKLDKNDLSVEFLAGNEKIEGILAAVKRASNLNNVNGVGATNLVTLNYPDICDNTHPYVFMFQFPEEIKFINRIKLSYVIGAYRAFGGTTGEGSPHTHKIKIHAPFDNSTIGTLGIQTYNMKNWFVCNKSVTAVETDETEQEHTHGVSFAITEQAANLTDVMIEIDDGSGYVDRTAAIETALGRALSTTQDLNLALQDYFTADGGIKKIRITPTGDNDGECRITGLLSVQFYMESR